MVRPKVKASTKQIYQYSVLLSESLVSELMPFVYGRKLSNMIEIIVEDYLDNSRRIEPEAFIEGVGGKKDVKIKLYFTHGVACRIEKRRNEERRNKSEFIRYVLKLWLMKQKQ